MTTTNRLKLLAGFFFSWFCIMVPAHAQLTISASTGELVGINTPDPEVELHILDDDKEGIVGLRLQPYGTNSDATIQFYEHTAAAMSLYYSGSQNDLRLYDLTANESRVTFMRSGNVGIGTQDTPGALLEVAGSQRSQTIWASESPGGADVGRLEIGYDSDDDFRRIQVWDGDTNAPTDLVLQTAGGNVGIGTGEPLTTAPGGKILYFGDNGGSPPAMAIGTAGLYAKDFEGTVELFAVDENSNSTQISPHDPVTGEWVFYSKNIKTGRVVRVNMEKLAKKVEELTGEKFFEEWIEE